MQKKEDGTNTMQSLGICLLGSLLAFGVNIAILMVVAGAVSGGYIPQRATGAMLIASCALSVFGGSQLALRMKKGHEIFVGVCVSVFYTLLLMSFGVVLFGNFTITGQGLVMVSSSFCGGLIASLTVNTGKKKPAKRRDGHGKKRYK